jgi:hypothetical protein
LLPYIFEQTSVVLVISPLNIIQKDQQRKLNERGITSCRLDIVANVIKEEEEERSEYTGKSSENFEDVVKGNSVWCFVTPWFYSTPVKGGSC